MRLMRKGKGNIQEQNRRRRIRFKEFIKNYKKDKHCKKCGYCEHTEILGFHHLRDKKIEINQIDTSIKRFNEEIKKCVLLCPNCHALEPSC
jgi:hypothetical protein